MAKKENIVRFTAEELTAATARGEGHMDWEKINATTAAEINAQAAEDQDDAYFPPGWEKTAFMGMPPKKAPINLRIDEDVLAWFKDSGRGYQTRINSVLRAFVESRRRETRRGPA